jgi:NADH-quinone oxidoreductase subunit J
MPHGDFQPIAFSLIAAWVLVAAVGVVTLRNIVHSAIAMVLCFMGVAAVYALLHAELLAIVQILVYVGAISVVILFAIMLTEAQRGPVAMFFNRQSIFALPLAVGVAAVVSAALISSQMPDVSDKALNPGVWQISRALFSEAVFPFELVSLVLLAAMIGAILLARREDEGR